MVSVIFSLPVYELLRIALNIYNKDTLHFYLNKYSIICKFLIVRKSMLKSLLIKNYALIENITVEFGAGLNIITGETGAGKTILLDAIGLLLGERASMDTIRKGTNKAVIEGTFQTGTNKIISSLLAEHDLDEEPVLIIRREISRKGSSRSFVNDTPVTLSVLKEFGDILVDLHGQHEHQSLLKTDTHIDFLDGFGGYESLIQQYKSEYSLLKSYRKELNDLLKREAELREKKEFYAFQAKEIDQVNPQPNEDEELDAELNILENAERLLELVTAVSGELYEDDDAVYVKLSKVQDNVEELSEIDPAYQSQLQELQSAISIIEELHNFSRDYRSRIEMDPDRLNMVRDRLGELHLLKKKHSGTLADVIAYREKIGREIQLSDDFEDEIQSRKENVQKQNSVCAGLAAKLSVERKKAAKTLSGKIVKALAELGIEKALFKVEQNRESVEKDKQNSLLIDNVNYRFTDRGIDAVQFLISTNVGEDPKPLVKVASGGEISRIMLALKSILARKDKYPVLIFDEIDTGVSGRIASKVGSALKGLSQSHQIIAITHLPQIAGAADQHFVVAKKIVEGRAASTINKLDDRQKVEEVAKLMSGEDITEAGIKGAKELMGITN